VFGCTAVSERITVRRTNDGLEGYALVGVTLDGAITAPDARSVQLTRQVLVVASRQTWPVRLSRTKWPWLVKRIWEPSLPALVPCR
jgi:hypothetical protein